MSVERDQSRTRCHVFGLSVGGVALILLAGLSAPVSAAEPPGSPELKRLGNWMAHYYEQPEPNRLATWIADISAAGGLDKASARAPLAMFMSEVARQYPDKVGAWCDALVELPAQHLGVVAWSFRNAGVVAYERCTRPLAAEFRARLSGAKPYSPLNQPATRPGDLDMLWAVFSATGDDRPVNMIVDVLARPLPERTAPGSVEALLMNGAAKWSLAANARQHRRVAEILRQRQETASGALRQELDQLLAKNP